MRFGDSFRTATAGLFLFFAGCSTDFDVIAPYREIPVVYGLLNVSDSVQWIRIQKAFLGEGNALVMAQEPDSVNYPDILDASLEEYGAFGQLLRTMNLLRDSSVSKNAGLFTSQPNFLYRTEPGVRLVAGNRYGLRVNNRVTDSTITASAEVVDSITINSPVSISSVEIRWYAGSAFPVKWNVEEEGFLYQLVIRFHFVERNTVTGVMTPMYIDWYFPEERKTKSLGEMVIEIEGEDFYRFVANSLDQKTDIKRQIGALDFNFIVAGEDFSTYFEVNKPPTGLNQNIPTFTNIQGGAGVFSSRLTQSVAGKNMDKQSRDSLIHGSFTKLLGFE